MIFHIGSILNTLTAHYIFVLSIDPSIIPVYSILLLTNCTHEPEFIGTVKWHLMRCSWETEPVDKPIIILMEFFELHLTKLNVIFHGILKPDDRWDNFISSELHTVLVCLLNEPVVSDIVFLYF